MSNSKKWTRVPAPCGVAIADLHARDGYLIVPKLTVLDGGYSVRRIDLFVPHCVTGEPVFWLSRRGGDMDHLLVLVKRAAREYSKRRLAAAA